MKLPYKILVISDSHGNYPLAIKATDVLGPVDSVVHLGDGLDDAKILEEVTGLPVTKVVGNCDFSTSLPSDMEIAIAGHQTFMTHGHKYGVKSGIFRLQQKALERGASLVLYGHTHVPSIETLDDLLFVNPGCLSENCPVKSCALLTIIPGKISAKIVRLD